MINFFRKKRKKLADDNKVIKYGRYAIGEIVLEVIGILIAFAFPQPLKGRQCSLLTIKIKINYL